MRNLIRLLVLTLLGGTFLLGKSQPAAAQSASPRGDNFSDTWAATDALGRKLPVGKEVPAPRKDRFVATFYFLWHGFHGTPGPYDITKLLAANPTPPAWGKVGEFHWWGEPEIGYFRADDPWVARRNLSLLADAGVDVMVFDATNGFPYIDEARLLLETARQMRKEGNRTPQFASMIHAGEAATMAKLWSAFYEKREYSELYFQWRGKPLLLGDMDAKDDKGAPYPAAIRDFFTWRFPWADAPAQRRWMWSEASPQHFSWDADANKPEQVAVRVASHPVNNTGRSNQNNVQPPHDKFGLTKTWPLGLHFEEQWKRARQIDPELVFVTGFNEWVAQRFAAADSSAPPMLGAPTKPGDSYFYDQYNAEFSRDFDPMKGGATDNYYYQLVANIRRFKGARRQKPASTRTTIKLDDSDADWKNVAPEYRDTISDTLHRDHAGWGTLHYINNSGRNDIIRAKVARDAKNIYFLAQTSAALTPFSDKNWMWLFIDSDQNAATGWNGYELAVNGDPKSKTATTLRRAALKNGVWTWERIGTVSYRAAGNTLEIAVPRSRLGQTKTLHFDFHWADNVDPAKGIVEFFTQGDSAPNRRFNYRYSAAN